MTPNKNVKLTRCSRLPATAQLTLETLDSSMHSAVIWSISRLLILCVAFAQTLPGQPAPLDYRRVSGCYNLIVGDWNYPRRVALAFHALPQLVRLDTTVASRGGRVLTPNISYPFPRPFRGLPSWDISADTVTMIWSDGFSPTFVRLGRVGDHLEGWVEARSDAIPSGDPDWPRAPVVARRARCAS